MAKECYFQMPANWLYVSTRKPKERQGKHKEILAKCKQLGEIKEFLSYQGIVRKLEGLYKVFGPFLGYSLAFLVPI